MYIHLFVITLNDFKNTSLFSACALMLNELQRLNANVLRWNMLVLILNLARDCSWGRRV